MGDLISRQAAIDMLKNRWKKTRNYEGIGDDIAEECELYLKQVPSAQPEHVADISKKVEGDCISRQAALDALDKRFDDVPMELTTEILQLRRDLRERIPSAQPATNCSEIPNGSDDTISRQAAIDALKKISFSHWFEFGEYLSEDTREIEIINGNKALEAIEALPSAQPQYTELTPEEAASEIASGSIMSASYWLDAMIRLKQMGYAICRKR